jgi:hypothetical protein
MRTHRTNDCPEVEGGVKGADSVDEDESSSEESDGGIVAMMMRATCQDTRVPDKRGGGGTSRPRRQSGQKARVIFFHGGETIGVQKEYTDEEIQSFGLVFTGLNTNASEVGVDFIGDGVDGANFDAVDALEEKHVGKGVCDDDEDHGDGERCDNVDVCDPVVAYQEDSTVGGGLQTDDGSTGGVGLQTDEDGDRQTANGYGNDELHDVDVSDAYVLCDVNRLCHTLRKSYASVVSGGEGARVRATVAIAREVDVHTSTPLCVSPGAGHDRHPEGNFDPVEEGGEGFCICTNGMV